MTCIIHAYFNASDTDDSVVELDEILKVEVEKEHVQSFNTRAVHRMEKSSNRKRRKRKNERGDHNIVFVDVCNRDGER